MNNFNGFNSSFANPNQGIKSFGNSGQGFSGVANQGSHTKNTPSFSSSSVQPGPSSNFAQSTGNATGSGFFGSQPFKSNPSQTSNPSNFSTFSSNSSNNFNRNNSGQKNGKFGGQPSGNSSNSSIKPFVGGFGQNNSGSGFLANGVNNNPPLTNGGFGGGAVNMSLGGSTGFNQSSQNFKGGFTQNTPNNTAGFNQGPSNMSTGFNQGGANVNTGVGGGFNQKAFVGNNSNAPGASGFSAVNNSSGGGFFNNAPGGSAPSNTVNVPNNSGSSFSKFPSTTQPTSFSFNSNTATTSFSNPTTQGSLTNSAFSNNKPAQNQGNISGFKFTTGSNNSGFGGAQISQPASSNPFLNTGSNSSPTDFMFTELSELTAQEKVLFEKDKFEVFHLPINPPPKSFC